MGFAARSDRVLPAVCAALWALAVGHLVGQWDYSWLRIDDARGSPPPPTVKHDNAPRDETTVTETVPIPVERMWTLRSRFDGLIHAVASEHGLDPALIKAIVQSESAFDPHALSVDGAQGLMQLMPSTAARCGIVDLLNPYLNLQAGVRHLKELIEDFDGDMHLAVAAYNAGKYAVRRHDGVPPYRETRVYMYRVFGLQSLYAADFSRSTAVAKVREDEPVKPLAVALK